MKTSQNERQSSWPALEPTKITSPLPRGQATGPLPTFLTNKNRAALDDAVPKLQQLRFEGNSPWKFPIDLIASSFGGFPV